MSTNIVTIETSAEDLSFTQFYGGEIRNICIQLTQGEKGYIALNKRDTYRTINILTEWLKKVSHNEADRLQEKINHDKILMSTIVQEALDCEKFIQDLDIIDMPLRLLDITSDKQT